MRKLLLFLSLFIVGACMMPSAAKWDLGEQLSASKIKAGDSVILEYVASKLFAGKYLTLNPSTHKGLLGEDGVLDDEKIWILEEGPADLRTNGVTYYLKHKSSGRYIKADGGFSAPFSTEVDVTNASNWLVASCGEDLPNSNCQPFVGNGDQLKEGASGDKIVNWGVNGDGKGEVSDNSVGFIYSSSETAWGYLTCYFGTISCTGLQMCNQWNIFKAEYTNDKLADLNSLIDLYSTFAPIGGTDPGYYSTEATDAYNSILQDAVVMLMTGGTDEEIDGMMEALKGARKACEESKIPIVEGYYYIVSAYDAFMNSQSVEKAVYPNTVTNKMEWKTFDANDGNFIFQITPSEENDMFVVQHYFTDLYAGKQDSWTGSGAKTSLITTGSYPQRMTMEVEGMWLWTDPAWSYPDMSNGKSPFGGTGNGETLSGTLAAWGRTPDANDKAYIYEHYTNLWYIRPVSEEVLNAVEPIKQQNKITAELKELIEEARGLYGKLFVYEVDKSAGLITVAGNDVAGNQITFSKINKQGVAYSDDYKFLIDDIDSTYMQGSGYIDIDISNTPKSIVAISYNTRCASGEFGNPSQQTWGKQERPARVNIYATNDTEEDAVWTLFGSTNMAGLELPATYVVNMGDNYSRIRYEVLNNATGGSYFTISELQLYPTNVDESSSQYYTTEGMQSAADAMKGLLPDMQAAVEANTATEANVTDLRQAIAAVRELYADTTELSALISESERLLEGVMIGSGMGELSEESLMTSLQQAVNDAKANAFVAPISVAAVKEATDAVSLAKNAFLAGIKSVEPGKWYFITNMDTERMDEPGTEGAICGGSAIYLNSKYDGNSVVKWGLFDTASMTLNANNEPKAMWRFIPIEGTKYYAIQNMYTGYYLGDYAGDDINLPVSETAVPYDVAYSGNAQFMLYPRGGKNTNNFSLYPEGYASDVVCHNAIPNTASAWTFVEIDPEEQEAISIRDFAFNLIDVMTVPYNLSNIGEFNDDVYTYAVKKMTQEEVDGELVTTVELYEKSEFKAGEPCIIVLGNIDESVDMEECDLVIPFPTEMVDHTKVLTSSGLRGALHTAPCAQGTGISTGKKFVTVEGASSKFDAQTGVIDPSTYKGEVVGVETALTLQITGLNALPSAIKGDVNGDGAVNSADVVAIYNFINTGEQSGLTSDDADVNGDGTVSSADIVDIYNMIAGASGGSKKFASLVKKLLKGLKEE